MIIDEVAESFLKGNKFSNSQRFAINLHQRLIQRNARLVELARNKNVLHLGCADHAILIEEKIKQERYLHTLLDKVAKRLIGVDINEDGINTMRSLGIKDVYLPKELPSEQYDILIASDVIEHVPDVNVFLDGLRQYEFEQLIITTPNAFRLKNRWLLSGELVNTDHHYWFSPYTLAKVLVGAGYDVLAIEYTDAPSRLNFLRNIMLKRFPLIQEGLLAIASK